MAMRQWIRLMVAVGTVAGTVLVSPAAQASGPRYREYVAMGDSWTADVVVASTAGLPTNKYVPLGCAQATFDYPKQVAAALNVPKFFDASCGGATTDNFTKPQSPPLPIGGDNPPQFAHLTPTTDLVTVGMGGNDAGLAGAVVDCLDLSGGHAPWLPYPFGGAGCKAKWTQGGVDRMSQNIDASQAKLVAGLNQIRQISPRAKVFLVNYLAAGPTKGCYPQQPASAVDLVWITEKLRDLNAMLARAAQAAGATLVDTYTPTVGHDVCQAPNVRYAEGFLPVSLNQPALAVPFHPNSAGANAQAAIVTSVLTRTSVTPATRY
ncbi:SGNH/GDSL hydrolase family protein [Actinocrispum wychmicini]|uniref:GDSL-like lipase/acylhydrolase family protein n=1 Tax=Actinocrispum wychmicini TaxID=1213861 RepID=A0A4R2JLL2_9PSEU|nr:SGNH/GDSL hydrolase family protein [Actinocrispum wychmicini]TCO59757.1 GDSL-like lipase/acylhydrolase family protein [Actinocrispum wychmicini]